MFLLICMFSSSAKPSTDQPGRDQADEAKLFNFTAKPLIKREPSTAQKPTNRHPTSDHAFENDPNNDDDSNGSSLFVFPDESAEIVVIDETQPIRLDYATTQTEPPMLANDAAAAATDSATTKTIRTEYKLPPMALRTNKEKAAQPGFMCPDCAPVKLPDR